MSDPYLTGFNFGEGLSPEIIYSPPISGSASIDPSSARSGSSDSYSYADYLIRSLEKAEEEQFAREQQSAREAMEFEASQADLAYQRELYLSNTAVRRRMEDLRAAGVNPALAYSDAASTPSVGFGSGHAASSAMQARPSQNIAESEKLSKRERDSKIWSSIISAIANVASSAASSTAKVAAAGILAG